jgi:glyoxylase-like metal-dependent hydrolase (beta-lactamase superfamily II)
MNIESVPVGPFEANCVIVWDEESRAVVFDPGSEAERLGRFLAERGLILAACMLTHGHVDHVSGVAALLASRPAPLGLHPEDAVWAFGHANSMPPFYGAPAAPAEIERRLAQGQKWSDGNLSYTVLETPGHSPGSVCFLFDEGILVCGDTLFAGSVGRTDLPGGDARALQASLKRLAELPDDTTVYAGHGPVTSIGAEKKVNYFLRSCM